MADGQGSPFCRFCRVTCMIRSSTQNKSVNQKVLMQIFIKHLKTSFSDINEYWLLEGERRLQQINKQQRNSPIVQNDESTLTGPPKSCCKFKSQLHQINPEPSTSLVKKISQQLIALKSPQQTLINNVPISKVDCREKPLHQQLLSTMFQLSQRLIAEEISTTKLLVSNVSAARYLWEGPCRENLNKNNKTLATRDVQKLKTHKDSRGKRNPESYKLFTLR